MPEKNKNKKCDAKEQRRPRNRQQVTTERKDMKPENKTEQPKVPEKPAYEPPGPEFYKNLKRETDEILKISEETNSKYKNKEIISNWAKYEMPTESYDEIQERQDLGADYEQLIQAPLSIGSHFQFKHEKSWDVSTGPSLYDKYFEIDMDRLATALCTIPFHERNRINESYFTQTDILTMNNRTDQYKRKYYHNKSYTNVEISAQEKLCAILLENNDNEVETVKDIEKDCGKEKHIQLCVNKKTEEVEVKPEVSLYEKKKLDDEKMKTETLFTKSLTNDTIFNSGNSSAKTVILDDNLTKNEIPSTRSNDNFKTEKPNEVSKVYDQPKKILEDEIDDIISNVKSDTPFKNSELKSPSVLGIEIKNEERQLLEVNTPFEETKKNAAIESPEDLEKWLDDFLDG